MTNNDPIPVFSVLQKKNVCYYCKFVGHNEEKCYKKQKDQRIIHSEVNVVQKVENQGLNRNMKISTSIIIKKSVIQLQGLFDTGSSVSMMSKLSLLPGIKWETYNKRLSGVNGSPVVVYGAVKAQIIMNSILLDLMTY